MYMAAVDWLHSSLDFSCYSSLRVYMLFLQESLLHYTGEDKNAEAQSQILTALCSKAMQV